MGTPSAPHRKIVGEEIFLDAAFLKPVEFLPRLPLEVVAVYDKHAFFDVGGYQTRYPPVEPDLTPGISHESF